MCQYCGNEYRDRVYRNTACPVCDKDLKICFNCRETIPEPVRDKVRANFCDYFVYVLRKPAGPRKGGEAASDARNKFDSLFQDE